MKNRLIASLILLVTFKCYAKCDTAVIENQKGFILLSAHNFQYDYQGAEMNPLGFHDFFFPSGSFCIEEIKNLKKSSAVFKDGLRIDFINNRQKLKDLATKISGKDTTFCYGYEWLYVIPVTISYKRFEDYEPYVCRQNFFDFTVEKGGTIHFQYQHIGILPFKITPILNQKVKPKTNPAKKK